MCVCIELNKERILQLQTLRGGGEEKWERGAVKSSLLSYEKQNSS